MAVKGGKAGAMRSYRGPHRQSQVPWPAPSSQGRGGPGGEAGEWGPPLDCIPDPRGPRIPSAHAELLRTRRAGPGQSPPPRLARPLTFTFPASRRPSHSLRHQRAPPRGEAGGGKWISASPVASDCPSTRVSWWTLSPAGSPRLLLTPLLPRDSALRAAPQRATPPPARPKRTTQRLGLPLHHGGCSSGGRRPELGGGAKRGGASSCQGAKNQGRGVEVPAFSPVVLEPDPGASASSGIQICIL